LQNSAETVAPGKQKGGVGIALLDALDRLARD
jgi:hypothetical protein